MKRKIKIPVVVCPNGEMYNGSIHVPADEECPEIKRGHWDFAIDGLSEEGYGQGYAVVLVEAEIDIDAVFCNHKVQGQTDSKAHVTGQPEVDPLF